MLNKFKIFLTNILLFITSIILILIFFGIGVITALIKIIFYKASTKYFRDCAIVIDVLGNVLCQHLFNVILIKEDSKNKFGKIKETISSVVGKNILTSQSTFHKVYYIFKINNVKFLTFGIFWYSDLKFLGSVLANILDKLDKNHCLKSIDNNV